MVEFNVLIGQGVLLSDRDLFFGPLIPTDEFLEFPSETRWPVLLKEIGVFSSTSDGRRNGWNLEILEGWTDIRVGKLKKRICILKIL